MDFRHCPSFAFADHAVLLQRQDGSWGGVDADGVPATYSDEEMAAAVTLLDYGDGKGLFAVPDATRGGETRRFKIDHAAGLVHIEGAARSMPMNQFFRHAVRVDPQGIPVCSFMQPLHEQYLLCRERPGCESHCFDIADLAEAMRKSEAVSDLIDVGLYDVVSSGLDDGMPFMEVMARVTARSGRPVHETFGLDRALPGDWAEIREFPQYMMAPIRALFGSYMQERIGEFPLERVSRLHAPPGTPLAMRLEAIAELVSTDEPFDGGNVIRGYRTSPVAHYRGDGFDAIVFSDMAGTYAYAWPTQPGPVAGPSIPEARP